MTDTQSQIETARAHWQRGDTAAAEGLLRAILARTPVHGGAAALLAQLLQADGRLGAASEAMAALWRSSPPDAALAVRCVRFLRDSRRQRLAARLCDEAFAAGCGNADLYALAGLVARELGDFDGARRHLLAALDAGVDLDAWYVLGALASVQRYDSEAHPDFARLRAHFHGAPAAPGARAATGFGLAKAYDDVGDYAAAAAVLRAANALARGAQPWACDAWRRWVDARVHAPGGAATTPCAVPETFTPIFIVGLPRSGTTLAARQLAAHAGVVDRGELPLIPYIAARLAASGRAGDPAALREAAGLYCRHLQQDDPAAPFYVDGNQMNFRHLDLVARLLPNARVIHCVRSRRDAALSIYRQHFAHADCAFANDFGDIAAFAAGHDRLMAHWSRRLPLPIHTVAYEALVDDTAATVAQLRRFAGVAAARGPVDDAPITSSSLWQARQPVYRSSLEHWRAYAPHLPDIERRFPPDERGGGARASAG